MSDTAAISELVVHDDRIADVACAHFDDCRYTLAVVERAGRGAYSCHTQRTGSLAVIVNNDEPILCTIEYPRTLVIGGRPLLPLPNFALGLSSATRSTTIATATNPILALSAGTPAKMSGSYLPNSDWTVNSVLVFANDEDRVVLLCGTQEGFLLRATTKLSRDPVSLQSQWRWETLLQLSTCINDVAMPSRPSVFAPYLFLVIDNDHSLLLKPTECGMFNSAPTRVDSPMKSMTSFLTYAAASEDGRFVVATGDQDCCVVVWTVEEDYSVRPHMLIRTGTQFPYRAVSLQGGLFVTTLGSSLLFVDVESSSCLAVRVFSDGACTGIAMCENDKKTLPTSTCAHQFVIVTSSTSQITLDVSRPRPLKEVMLHFCSIRLPNALEDIPPGLQRRKCMRGHPLVVAHGNIWYMRTVSGQSWAEILCFGCRANPTREGFIGAWLVCHECAVSSCGRCVGPTVRTQQ